MNEENKRQRICTHSAVCACVCVCMTVYVRLNSHQLQILLLLPLVVAIVVVLCDLLLPLLRGTSRKQIHNKGRNPPLQVHLEQHAQAGRVRMISVWPNNDSSKDCFGSAESKRFKYALDCVFSIHVSCVCVKLWNIFWSRPL